MTAGAQAQNRYTTGGAGQSGRQVIIQCSACSTKFSVAYISFADVAEPRFHCSRCDHVFVVESELLCPPNETTIHLIDEEPTQRLAPLSSASTSSSPASSNQIADAASDPASDFPDPISITELEHSDTPVAPAEPLSLNSPRKPQQLSFNFDRDTTATIGPARTPGPVAPASSAVPLTRIQAMLQGDTPGLDLNEELFFDEALQARTREFSPWLSFSVLVAPLAILITAIVATNYFITWRSSADKLPAFLQRGEALVPPAGLRVVESTFRRVTLSSGDTIALVSGTLANDDLADFESVTLEALAFNDTGQIIRSTIARLGSSLSQARIRSLTPKMIAELQAQAPTRTAPIKPTERRQFTLVFLDDSRVPDQLAAARYFAARVYSAQ